MNSKCCQRKLFKDYLGHIRCSECLLVSSPKKSFRMAYIALFSLLFLSFTIPNIKHSFSSPIKYTIKEDSCKDVELNRDSIFQEMCNDTIFFAEYAIKQVIHETGNLTSDLAIKYNNILGITYCNSKYQSGWILGNGIKFATYKSKKDCLKDYKRLQSFYTYKMDKYYSDNKKYTQLLK